MGPLPLLLSWPQLLELLHGFYHILVVSLLSTQQFLWETGNGRELQLFFEREREMGVMPLERAYLAKSNYKETYPLTLLKIFKLTTVAHPLLAPPTVS